MADAESARTRLLDVALRTFREKGYTATTVDDLCRAACVTKGAFFHHFDSKEAAALAAVEHWNTRTGALFEAAPYWQVEDPRARLLAYLDFRAARVRGELPEFTCLLGTLVQETFASHPALQAACGAGIEAHAQTLVPTIEAARARYAPKADWSAESLARHIQAVLQGGFVLAKALNDPRAALEAIAHLKRYVEGLLPVRRNEARNNASLATRFPTRHPPSKRR
ncbi:TetR/AcrR family transcriptional regulator [Sinimarinibacterium thermocellulolyticum]|uniref:TetR/AcrR family transcriptional regulator n=1 Tax=Sinimarinibacterium thermocellulolyticum TaxID=3170016 RepID=A0ABV2ABX9_9GAMM